MGGKYDLRHFAYLHLPPHLQCYSKIFYDLATEMVERLPAGAERNAGLRKLLEAKDCFVRAAYETYGSLRSYDSPQMSGELDPVTGNPLPKDSPYSDAHYNSMRYDRETDKYIIVHDGVETVHDVTCLAVQHGKCTCGADDDNNRV